MKTTLLPVLFALGFIPPAAALEPPPTQVVVLDHAKVAAAFAQGAPLLANTVFKVSAGRRVTAGEVEVHDHDTDIFYVVEGSATFVTGGTVVQPRTTAPGEVRGSATTGGTPRQLTKGDIIVIPKGVAHWFNEVSGTFLYYVVKVTN